MSAMVISSVTGFVGMSKKLEEIGIKNIHFYNSINNDELTTPMITLMPFMDVVVLGKDADCSHDMARLVDEAMARHIPVVSEECLNELKNFYC